MPDLFDPFDLHGLTLPNRIVMSAMTRTRATEDDVPTEAMRDYYVQRASAGLIVTEATQVSPQAHGISYLYGVDDGNKLETFGFVVRALDALRVGYLCLLEPNAKDAQRGVQIDNVAATFRPMTSVPIIVNTGFDKAKANAILANGNADLVAFGVSYIANPDLVARFRSGASLNAPDPATFYGLGPKGYTDYPVLPVH